MSSTMLLLTFLPALVELNAQPKEFPQPPPPKNVTITGIAGVVEAGAKWTPIWQGNETADGITASEDGGLLMAQEQTNHINKLDKNGKFSVFLSNQHGTGSVAIGPKGRLV